MQVLDLFSGLGGFSQAFKDRGHEVITVDNDPKFRADIKDDIMKIDAKHFAHIKFDVILASPPCNCFSPMSIPRYWKDGQPGKEAKESIRLVHHTLGLIFELHPKFWFLENPMGMLRTVIGNPPVRVFYAQYGEDRLKPTDVWGRHPDGFKEMQITDKSLLDYTKCPRGSKIGGTQGMKNAEVRAKIPYKLSETICKLCEKHVKEG
jgi:hypothetical protein